MTAVTVDAGFRGNYSIACLCSLKGDQVLSNGILPNNVLKSATLAAASKTDSPGSCGSCTTTEDQNLWP